MIQAQVDHDRWCPLELGGGAMCLCNPDVEIEVDVRRCGEDGMPVSAKDGAVDRCAGLAMLAKCDARRAQQSRYSEEHLLRYTPLACCLLDYSLRAINAMPVTTNAPSDSRQTPDYDSWRIVLDVPSPNPRLGFERYRSAFADLILTNPPQFAVGIFGGWGSGKTTLMSAIQESIQREAPETIVVTFNAWRFEKEEHLIIPLLDAVREAMLRARPPSKNARSVVQGAARTIGFVTQSIMSGLAFKVGVPGAVDFSFDANKALTHARELGDEERIKQVPRSVYFASFQALQEAFSSLYTDCTKQRIVVFIDDLDRCLPNRAVDVLESIKLFFDIPGFIFVLGLDRKIIESHLDDRYPYVDHDRYDMEDYSDSEQQYVRINNGTDYIKKMFQVPFTLSPVSPLQIDDFLNCVRDECEFPESQTRELNKTIRPHLDYLVAENGVNPREIKRYLNAYTLTMKTKSHLKRFDPDVVLAIQTLAFVPEWRRIYEALLGSPRLFLRTLSDRVGGNVRALWNYDPNLTGISPRLIDYLSTSVDGESKGPGASLISEEAIASIDDYIHHGAAALESIEYSGDAGMLAAVGEFRDLREHIVAITPQHQAPSSEAAGSLVEALGKLADEFSSHIAGKAGQEIQARINNIIRCTQSIIDSMATVEDYETSEELNREIRRDFGDVLDISANYLTHRRVQRFYS